jgi:hypothetical protein
MSKHREIDISEEIKVAENVDLTLKVEAKSSTGPEPLPVDISVLEKARELIRTNLRLIKEEKDAIPA